MCLRHVLETANDYNTPFDRSKLSLRQPDPSSAIVNISKMSQGSKLSEAFEVGCNASIVLEHSSHLTKVLCHHSRIVECVIEGSVHQDGCKEA